jgi:serine/threonine protein kinase, bacterial
LPRQDALKVLPTSISADEEFRVRFNREADLAATLWHPHIVGVHDRGEFGGRLWISMDYVEGLDAAALSHDQYPEGMPVTEVVEIVSAVAEALDYAHERLLLHRDVKPANILLTKPGRDGRRRVLLADFGVARQTDDVNGLTATNMTIGSVSYTAPEQLMGDTVDGRADQYALAATAFHLLTGSPPFLHTNPAVVISRHLNTPPPALSHTKAELTGMDSVIAKALSKDPDDRYATCQDFAREFTQAVSRSPAAETATHIATPPVVTAAAPPVEPPTTVTQVVEPTVQHSTPPPVVVSRWAGSDQPTDTSDDVSPPPPAPTPPSQIRLDPLLVVVASVAGIALVAILTFIALENL